MTRDSFDLVARRLATSPSRRNLLHLFAAIVLGKTIAPNPSLAAPKRKSRRAPCQKLNRACTKRKPCCPGAKCLRGQCRCTAAAKPCAGACIPRAACCPTTGDGCGGPVCHPSNGCCPPGTKLCGQICIAAGACCTDSDCTGACQTGTCVTGRCSRAAPGTPCDAGTRRCNGLGVCARTCDVQDPCPQPSDNTTPAEFCRQVVCDNQACEETHKPNHTRLPGWFQEPGDCKVLECIHDLPNGIGVNSTDSDHDVPPPHPNDCVESYCLNFEPATRNRQSGTPCNSGAGQCNGQGICI